MSIQYLEIQCCPPVHSLLTHIKYLHKIFIAERGQYEYSSDCVCAISHWAMSAIRFGNNHFDSNFIFQSAKVLDSHNIFGRIASLNFPTFRIRFTVYNIHVSRLEIVYRFVATATRTVRGTNWCIAINHHHGIGQLIACCGTTHARM